jgi:hypothetical protein
VKLGTREKVLLLVLTGLAMVQGARMLLSSLGEGSLALPIARSSAVRRAAEAVEVAAVSELDLEALQPSTGVTAIGRDPFRYESLPNLAPPPPPPPPPAPRPDRRSALAAAARAAAETPPKPAIGVHFLGSFGNEKRRLAVLADGETITNAMEGDTVLGRLIVERIGLESVDLRFVDRPDLPAERLAVGP